MANVTIYTTPTCGYCKQAKAYFAQKNVEYTEKDVTIDAVAQKEMIDKSGQMGVPIIEIDGKIIVGFDQKKIEGVLGVM